MSLQHSPIFRGPKENVSLSGNLREKRWRLNEHEPSLVDGKLSLERWRVMIESANGARDCKLKSPSHLKDYGGVSGCNR